MTSLSAICVRGFLAALFAVFFLGFVFGSTASAQEKVRLGRARTSRTQQPITLQLAKARLVSNLYRGNLSNLALFANPRVMPAGTRIASWKRPDQVVVDQNSWFFFVDEKPGAKWEHQASYILVNQKTGQVRRISATTPPMNIIAMEPQNKKAAWQKELLRRNLRSVRRTVIKQARFEGHKEKKYAVLVGGGGFAHANDPQFWNDLRFIYRTLRGKYKFTDREIVVLYANGTHLPSGDLDGNGTNDIDFAATRFSLDSVLKGVANNIAADGKFFFFATSHGGRTMEGGHEAYMYLWHEWIHDQELAALTKNIKCAQAIYVMDLCYSGGMLDDLLRGPSSPCKNPAVCVMSASNYDEIAWYADTEGLYSEYSYHWTSALNGKTPGGKQVNADTNQNGVVSVAEAHFYASRMNSMPASPRIKTCASGACNAGLYHVQSTVLWPSPKGSKPYYKSKQKYESKKNLWLLEKPVWPSARGTKPDIMRVPKK